MSLRCSRILILTKNETIDLSELETSELVQMWCILSEVLGVGAVTKQHPQFEPAWQCLAAHIDHLIQNGDATVN